jgi:hypothetical protein
MGTIGPTPGAAKEGGAEADMYSLMVSVRSNDLPHSLQRYW